MLTLPVQSDRRVEILPGTPLVFVRALSGAKGMAPSRVGSADRPWHSLVRLIGQQPGQPLPFAVSPLGSPRSVAISAGEGELKVTEASADEAVLDADHVHRVGLAASPEAMSGVAPGTYGVRALLLGESPLESAPVTIVVREKAPGRDGLERERIARSAEFYLQAKRFEDARRLAQELSSRQPKNPGAWMLAGDALAGLGRPREALAAYRRALAVSPRTYEEPTLLYERMASVLQKIGPANAK